MNWKLLCLFLIIYSCKEESNKGFTLSGTIKGDSPDYIYLHYGNVKDSSLVIDGKFSFNGKVDFPINSEFTIIPLSTIDRVFYLENTTIDIHLTIEKKGYKNMKVNFIKIDTVIGTLSEKMQSDFEIFENKNSDKVNWDVILYEKLNTIIQKNPAHQCSGDLLIRFSKDSVLSNNQLKLLYKKLDTLNQSTYITESLKKRIFTEKNIKVGGRIFDFELPNDKGIIINTKKYRGNLLFIDFWASWCMPCRKQNPKLLKIYSNFKDDGFQILGVSIDTEREKWLKSIEKDKLTWENVIDEKGKESETLIKYDATSSIPRNYLIGKNGKILKIDISLQELEEYLKMK
jgi:peroxiredoxin